MQDLGRLALALGLLPIIQHTCAEQRCSAVAAAVVALPMGYYFLRSSPVTGQSPAARPAEATLNTPESRGQVITQRPKDTENEMNERSQLLGNETGAGNFRAVDPTAKVQRGKKVRVFRSGRRWIARDRLQAVELDASFVLI